MTASILAAIALALFALVIIGIGFAIWLRPQDDADSFEDSMKELEP